MAEELNKQLLEMMKSTLSKVSDESLVRMLRFAQTATDDVIEEMAKRDLKIIVVKD